MSKLSMRLVAFWIAGHEVASIAGVTDQRATIALGVLGMAAAFFTFVDTTSYKSVRKSQ